MPLNDFRSVFMPYCLKKQTDGRYAVLNREYKPVGFYTREEIIYESFPVLVKFKRLTTTQAKKISFNGDPNTSKIFLYNDSCVPTHSASHMKAYLGRLENLARLRIVAPR